MIDHIGSKVSEHHRDGRMVHYAGKEIKSQTEKSVRSAQKKKKASAKAPQTDLAALRSTRVRQTGSGVESAEARRGSQIAWN